MNKFKDCLEAYDVDYQTTMERFMGNEGLYVKLLDMLFQDPNLEKLKLALKSDDMDSAFEAAHTLKGVVGNMGLTSFYSTVCTIVEPLRRRENRDDYSVMYKDVQDEFEKTEELRDALKALK